MSTNPSLVLYRVAEKFTILNDRINGLIKRLYYMKQELNSNDKPLFLPGGDKMFEAPLKVLCKKFPVHDPKMTSSVQLAPLVNIHEEILNKLSHHYYTFVEITDLRKPIFDLLEILRKLNIQLDISVNFELTKHFLDLVTNYSTIFLLLSKFTDTKAIMALFNFAYEYKTTEQEKHVQIMSEKLLEQQPEKILKQLYGDFSPFARIITSAVRSLSNCFIPRLVKAQNWSEAHFLDILHEPDKLSHTALTDRMCTQLLPVEIMERWIIICTFFIHSELINTELYNVWKTAYKNSYTLVLFRDEILHFHGLTVQFFDAMKNSTKRSSEIKEMYQQACSQSPTLHKDRRNYLRLTLRQLCQIISDEPGLLGPKSFLVLWTLSYATDEVHWLLRHSDNVPAKKGPILNLNIKVNTEEFIDALLPELLFYIEEIRRLILKFAEVIQVFYQQILAEYDAPGLKYMVKDIINRCGSDSAVILSSMYQTLASMDSVEPSRDGKSLNFTDLRLDWFRVQFYLSIGGSPISLGQNIKLISHINSTIFHTKMIDYLTETVKDCADLSIFCFYDSKFHEYYERNITYSSQHRFAVVFPLICTHYINACDDSCPEETKIISRRAITNATKCLKNISTHICQLVSQTMDAYSSLALQLTPREALFYMQSAPDPRNNKHKKSMTLPGNSFHKSSSNTGGKLPNSHHCIMNGAAQLDESNLPGIESRRKTRENPTGLDKSLLALTQLCFTINHYREIIVWDRAFIPREILYQELVDMFNDKIVKAVELPMPTSLAHMMSSTTPTSTSTVTNNHTNTSNQTSQSSGSSSNGGGSQDESMVFVRQPSQLWIMLQQYMYVLMNIDKHANIEIVRIFTDVFLSQSQLRDTFKGNPTIVSAYIKWYLETIMKLAYKDIFVWSPLLKTFVTVANADGSLSTSSSSSQQLAFRAEDYTDLNEMRALVDIIGAFGMRLMTDAICQEISKIFEDKLKKLVSQNKTTLESLRDSLVNDVPCAAASVQKSRKLISCLLGVDDMLGTLKRIGLLCALRDLCGQASRDVLSTRVPFLFASVADLQHEYHSRNEAFLTQLRYQQQQQSNNGATDQQSTPESIYARVSEQLLVNDLCLMMGLRCRLDSNLCSAVENRRRLASINNNTISSTTSSSSNALSNSGAGGVTGTGTSNSIPDQEYKLAYLLVTFVAYSLPRLAQLDNTIYIAELEAHLNNAHCLAYALDVLMPVLFSRYGQDELDLRHREFMALASSNLLRIGLECNSGASGGGLLSSGLNAGSSNDLNTNIQSGGGGSSNQNHLIASSASHPNRYSVYILFDLMWERCASTLISTVDSQLSADLKEACFPYSLIRQAYQCVARQLQAGKYQWYYCAIASTLGGSNSGAASNNNSSVVSTNHLMMQHYTTPSSATTATTSISSPGYNINSSSHRLSTLSIHN